jgi:lysophospholipase L1-like esterase
LLSDDLYETGLLWNGRLHQVTAQIPGVCFWDWNCILSQPRHFGVDGLHPSVDGNTLLHMMTASRIQQMLSTDRQGQLM